MGELGYVTNGVIGVGGGKAAPGHAAQPALRRVDEGDDHAVGIGDGLRITEHIKVAQRRDVAEGIGDGGEMALGVVGISGYVRHIGARSVDGSHQTERVIGVGNATFCSLNLAAKQGTTEGERKQARAGKAVIHTGEKGTDLLFGSNLEWFNKSVPFFLLWHC